MDKKPDKVPFYKDIYNRVEKEIGVIDLIIGLGLGVSVCGLYWRHAWKNH